MNGRPPEIQSLLECGCGKPTLDGVASLLAPRLSEWAASPQFATKILSEVGKRRRPELAELILTSMSEGRVEVNVFHFSAVISASEKAGAWTSALHFLREMTHAAVTPNEFSYSAAISAFEKGGQWEGALGLLTEMQLDRRKRVDRKFGRGAYLKSDSPCAAPLNEECPCAIVMRRLCPNEVTYGASISACARGSNWISALELLSGLQVALLQVNVVTISAALTACEKAHRREGGGVLHCKAMPANAQPMGNK